MAEIRFEGRRAGILRVRLYLAFEDAKLTDFWHGVCHQRGNFIELSDWRRRQLAGLKARFDGSPFALSVIVNDLLVGARKRRLTATLRGTLTLDRCADRGLTKLWNRWLREGLPPHGLRPATDRRATSALGRALSAHEYELRL
jgi:hypothetical protein